MDRRPIVLPQDLCSVFPEAYCPLSTSAYGFKAAAGGGCTLEHWVLPDSCILPPPPVIFPPLLGRWERQSQVSLARWAGLVPQYGNMWEWRLRCSGEEVGEAMARPI